MQPVIPIRRMTRLPKYGFRSALLVIEHLDGVVVHECGERVLCCMLLPSSMPALGQQQ